MNLNQLKSRCFSLKLIDFVSIAKDFMFNEMNMPVLGYKLVSAYPQHYEIGASCSLYEEPELNKHIDDIYERFNLYHNPNASMPQMPQKEDEEGDQGEDGLSESSSDFIDDESVHSDYEDSVDQKIQQISKSHRKEDKMKDKKKYGD